MSVTSYVSSARALSIAIVVLGGVGWKLAVLHSNRGATEVEARAFLILDEVEARYPSKAQLIQAAGGPSGSLNFQSFDGPTTVYLTKRGDDVYFRTGARRPGGPGLISNQSPREYKYGSNEVHSRLTAITAELGVSFPDDRAKVLQSIHRALYFREIKPPGIDFGSFRSELAVWILSFLCLLGLVVIRSRVHTIFRDPEAGISEPWLILDARSFLEKAVSTAWLLGLAASSWVVNGALLLTVTDLHQAAAVPPEPWVSLPTYAVIIAITIASGWTSLRTVLDILLLRRIRSRVLQQEA